MARVTVVNDNPEFLELIREILESDRFEATTIDGDQADALDRIRASRPDVLMIDLRLGRDGLHGWRVAQEVRRDPELDGVPILVCSGDVFALRDIEADLATSKHVAALEKPFSIDQLTDTIDELLAEPTRG